MNFKIEINAFKFGFLELLCPCESLVGSCRRYHVEGKGLRLLNRSKVHRDHPSKKLAAATATANAYEHSIRSVDFQSERSEPASLRRKSKSKLITVTSGVSVVEGC
jgi:hypothetical protein